ncbi:NYN domain-containing protein [Corynebacterium amycolatum]|uniref:NYN domain-containing protein n=1 Tax=Corynebacterium amycolatum TaxID=43765 RepID=UPI002119D5FE|nr:NYN domain-containing protein [Corynebacterium amycolatum]MCQ9125674.1 NYN domain-containing protein [Corynebacterium amycolatum]MCQ9169689.1 NYN domain-containing protein [Corynebacterium amycolatum]MCQ9175636.1 NYN domain-containing protein [Corynebacterium amycolatum]
MNTIRSTKSLRPNTRPRRLILIDIENFNGGPIQSPSQVEWCKSMLTRWLNIEDGEIIVIASDESGLLAVNTGWKGPRLLMGVGADGADNQLIEEIEYMNYGQFDEIALVSGDGIFADPVARAAGLGVPTTVYSHGFQLSKRLQLAAAEVYLAEDGYVRKTTKTATATTTNADIIQLYPNPKETA